VNASHASAANYLYDGNNRVVAVADGETIIGSYVYEGTEPDLRVQLDNRTMRVGASALRQSATLGNILSVAYTRPYGSVLGTVRFDESTRTFHLPSDFGVSPPDAIASNSLTRRKLVDVDTGDVEARINFDRPSNVMFLPPEYSTINCALNCVFNGVVVKGNGSLGPLSVPIGSTVSLTAVKASGSTCTLLLCDWSDNGLPIGSWSPMPYTFTTTGTHQVEAACECSPCDLLGAGYLYVNVTTNPPPPVGPPVTITYTTFIPLDHVRLTPPVSDYFYEADNLGTFTPGVYRVQQTLTVRTGQGIVTPSAAQSALSRLFLANSPTTNLTTTGTCFRKNCPQCAMYPGFGTPINYEGQCLIRSAPDQGSATALDMNTVQAELIGAGYYDANRNYVTVRLSGSPKIGISPNFFIGATSPAIDWNVTITLVRNNSTGVTTYNVTGSHDGFPFHDIRINSTQVWARDPIPNGDTPLSLFPPAEIAVAASGALP